MNFNFGSSQKESSSIMASSTSNNPFDEERRLQNSSNTTTTSSSRRNTTMPGTLKQKPSSRTMAMATSQNATSTQEPPPIWAARHVEWPIPTSLSLQTTQKLISSSQQAGAVSGFTMMDPTTSAAESMPSANDTASATAEFQSSGATGESSSKETTAAQEGSYSFVGGFMSRVLQTTPNHNDSSSSQTTSHALLQQQQQQQSLKGSSSSSSTALPPPRAGCVATANSWMVASLECPISVPSTTSSHNHNSSNNSIRLLSRWNVRRMSGVDHWMALPPPVMVATTDGTTEAPSSASAYTNSSSIQHVFTDPTGCHTLLSAKNGEAYYHHSSLRVVQKLAGFGPDSSGQYDLSQLTGIPASTLVQHPSSASSQSLSPQVGLSAGSYVTAVAWDRERGTEGSSKQVLLGTNTGEIYEYSFHSPNFNSMEDTTRSSHKNTGTTSASSSSANNNNSNNTADHDTFASGETNLPKLLHQLNSDGQVTGLAFERLRTGLLILCCTSGVQKRTRFYSFYSQHSSSFQHTLADENYASLVELPGSIERAKLCLCNDQFCLLTATGIYYGTMDRALSGPAFAGGSLIMDSGILPYAALSSSSSSGSGGSHSENGTTSNSSSVGVPPVSVALTPHHIITLTEQSELQFISRVSHTVIQTERVDWRSISASSSSNNNHNPHHASSLSDAQLQVGELLMDIRRPDQVWLRKGRSLVHISSSQEDRDVWKFTLEKAISLGTTTTTTFPPTSSSTSRKPPSSEEESKQEALFEQAKGLCTNPSQKAVVTAVRAEFHLRQGRAELAAKYFAQCPPVLAPFSDTAIRLALPMLDINDPKSYGNSPLARDALKSNLPLIQYLADKMRAGKNNNDNMTCTMIGAWLTELYLHEREHSSTSSNENSSSSTTRGNVNNSYAIKQPLSQFLAQNAHAMDSKTIMKLLSSHDVEASECATYAASSGDIATAVDAALQAGSASDDGVIQALHLLNDAPFEIAEPLYYKHATALLTRAPLLAGKSFLSRYTHGLSPTRLLPSIMHYEKLRADRAVAQQISQATTEDSSEGVEESKSMTNDIQVDGNNLEISLLPKGNSSVGKFVNDPNVSTKYLEGVIKLGCRSSSIFSYLISLYVKLEDEEPLYKFVSAHVSAAAAISNANRKARVHAEEVLSGPLDISYALRTVLTTGRHFRSAIKLYMGLGMRQRAVELALKVDPSLAREIAQESVELEERRRLWLMIAKNAAGETVNIGRTDIVAKVVSVLRDCGPDVLSIEDVLPFLPDFAQIDEIKDEICEALTSYSSKIEGFLKEMNECDRACDDLRGEITRLRTHRMEMKADARCAFTNVGVLNAGEPFYVFPSGYVVLESALKKEVLPFLNDRQRQRVKDIEKELKQYSNNRRQEHSRLDQLQAELDGLIAAECPLNGSLMISSIDKPFGQSEDDDRSYRRSLDGRGGTDASSTTATV